METEYRTPKRWIVAAVASVLLTLLAGYGFIYSATVSLYSERVNYLEEISIKSANLVKEQINGYFSTLEALATVIGTSDELRMEDAIELLTTETKKGNFMRMGVILPNGEAYTTDGLNNNLGDRAYFAEALSGHNAASDSLIDRFGGKAINVFAAPVFQNNKVQCVIFATKTQEKFSDALLSHSFHDKSYSYIVSGDGRPVIQTTHPDSIGEYENFFAVIQQYGMTEEQSNLIQEQMRKHENGVVTYTRGGIKRQIFYAPVGINDWYIFSVVAADVVSAQSDRLINNLVALMLFMTVMGIFISSRLLHSARVNNEKLCYLAYTDEITALPNWMGFRAEANKRLLCVGPENPYAMVTFDINKFKLINDLFGYQRGNEILVRSGEIIREALDEGECCCRAGADCFYLLVRYQNDEVLLTRLKWLEQRFEGLIDNYKIKLSMGICTIYEAEADISSYCDRANLSRTIAKKTSTSNYHFFKETNRLELLREKELENVMDAALEKGEFVVYMQPKFEAKNSALLGAEALVRWQRPNEGLVPPIHFIPLFEKNGFIRKLDLYMFESVCSWLEKQMREMPEKELLPISVNISRAHLSNPSLPDDLRRIAHKHGVPTKLLEIELTESAVFENLEEVGALMAQLKKDGFLLAIDDFGSGYSSLASLKALPADIVKMDKSFLDEAENDERGKRIIIGMVRMIKSLNMITLAEGVETLAQLEMLRNAGCDVVQGYYHARPMPLDDYEKLLMSKE
ncbi:MAG: EAL domain-containing protein [Clostridia bacterium]